jgi:hypothetical protein
MFRYRVPNVDPIQPIMPPPKVLFHPKKRMQRKEEKVLVEEGAVLVGFGFGMFVWYLVRFGFGV